tara:strand:+ start:2867 stop:3247 length:381 start_codon:yes stop_codon:yes gene_type:complete
MDKLINISKLCKILNLIDPKTKKPLNHTLRYWEKEFPQIKPKKINNHRYYSLKDVETIKIIKLLIKDKKISIAGVKNILSPGIKKLDDYDNSSLRNQYIKKNIKIKSSKLLEKIKRLKNYGKKNSS